MPSLHVEPWALADAGRCLATERSVLADVATAIGPALAGVASALPGSCTAEIAGGTGVALAAAVRTVAGELAQLAAALSAAARHYVVVEQSAATGMAHAGRRPV